VDSRVKRTVIILASVAVLLYIGFIVMAVTGNIAPEG
jgi:hypothetical protein